MFNKRKRKYIKRNSNIGKYMNSFDRRINTKLHIFLQSIFNSTNIMNMISHQTKDKEQYIHHRFRNSII